MRGSASQGGLYASCEGYNNDITSHAKLEFLFGLFGSLLLVTEIIPITNYCENYNIENYEYCKVQNIQHICQCAEKNIHSLDNYLAILFIKNSIKVTNIVSDLLSP